MTNIEKSCSMNKQTYTTDGKVRWLATEEDVNDKLISILGKKFDIRGTHTINDGCKIKIDVGSFKMLSEWLISFLKVFCQRATNSFICQSYYFIGLRLNCVSVNC